MEYEKQAFPSLTETIKKLKDDVTFEKQSSDLSKYDIFKEKKSEFLLKSKIIIIIKLVQKLFDNLTVISSNESRSIASFIGLAIGDSLGAISDGWDLSYTRCTLSGFQEENAKLPIGLYTDDTSMALCIADSILVNNFEFNGIDIRHRFLLWWFEGYNNGKGFVALETLSKYKFSNQWDLISFGIGNTTWNSLFKFFRNPNKEFISENFGDQNSNGCLMRLAPVCIAFHDNLEKAIDFAFIQSRLTNDGLEAAESCVLATIVIYFFINGENNLEKIVENSKKYFNFECENIDLIIKSELEFNWKKKDFKYSEKRADEYFGRGIGAYCLDALAMALHIVLFAKGFKECVVKAANLGGDADTFLIGAITGMIAGARFGFESEIIKMYEYVKVFDKGNIAIRAWQLFNKIL